MKERLDDLVQTIDNYFSKMIWDSLPPIKELDYQVILLSQKIIEARDVIDLNNADSTLDELINYIKQEFRPILFEETLEAESKKDEIRHKLILDIYSKLLKLKSNQCQ